MLNITLFNFRLDIMSVSMNHVNDYSIRLKVIRLYVRCARPIEQIRDEIAITLGTITYIINREIPDVQRKRIKRRNYSRSKIGVRNPMLGKIPNNYKGPCGDGYGYLTRLVSGKRYFVHRIVFAEMIGISVEDLPSSLHVHHINGVKTDNRPDNLALITNAGHSLLHSQTVAKRRSQTN